MSSYRRQPVLTSGYLALAFEGEKSDCYVVTTDELSRQMVGAYQSAVESTLAAVRTRIAEPVR